MATENESRAGRRWIVGVLAGALVLRLFLAALPGFGPDIGIFRDWAETIARVGPGDFYNQSGQFHAYAPGYLHYLWLLGSLDEIFSFSTSQWDYALKLPAIVADLGSAYLLYRFLEGRREGWRVGAAALYLLFPATLLIGPIWGQDDSILAFFVLLTVYFVAKDRPVAAALAFTAGFIVKPQAIAALPFLVFWIVRDHPPVWRRVNAILRVPVPPKAWLRMAGGSLLLTFVMIFPFFPSLVLWRPFIHLVEQVSSALNVWRYNAIFAYNFWNLFGRGTAGRCDSSACPNAATGHVTYFTHGAEFLGLPTRFWGFLLFAVAAVSVIAVLRRARGPAFLALGTSLTILAFYVFMTRMHERYLFPFFLPFLAACVLLKSRVLWAAFAVLGAVHFLNLYIVYTDSEDELRYQHLYDWLRHEDLWGSGLETAQLLSAIILAGLIVLVPTAYRLANRSPETA